MLLEHANVIGSFRQYRALGALGNNDTAARQEIPKFIDLFGNSKTPFLFPGIPFFAFAVVEFLFLTTTATR